MSELLLAGLKVIEVSSWIAAPACGTMLADQGADVIKVEPPETGDPYRQYYSLPPSPISDVNYTFILDNHNKQSITLNLKSDEGLHILKQMVADCDVYLTNQPLDFRRAQGLTYEDLSPLNDKLIYASMTAYGEEGPERDKEGFDLVGYWSRSGLMNQMRHKGIEPFQAMAGMGDHPTAVALYASVMTALLRRERTGEGSKVHTSLLANGLWSASCFAQSVWADGDFSEIPPQRLQTALYLTQDERWIQFSMVRTEEMFDRLIIAMDKTEWLADDRFATLESRVANYAECTDMMREVILTKTAADWMAIFQAADLPVALVAEFQDLPTDPQVLANNLAAPSVEDTGMERIVRDPINVDGLPRVGPKKAPEVGEHTETVLANLGYSPDDILALQDRGIV